MRILLALAVCFTSNINFAFIHQTEMHESLSMVFIIKNINKCLFKKNKIYIYHSPQPINNHPVSNKAKYIINIVYNYILLF